MNTIAERFASFLRAARTSPVRVHVHGQPVHKAQARFVDRVVLFACIASAGAALISTQIYDTPASVDTGHQDSVTAPASTSPLPEVWEKIEPGGKPPLQYVQVKWNGEEVAVLNEASRLRLVKEAAAKHELHKVGLNWKDLYGVIHAETNWVARDGMGKNGVVSLGLAQLEPATAQAIGVTDPHDPRQAIEASAYLLKEGALWARKRIQGLRLSPTLTAERVREGVSIYYNLSTRGRNEWNGQNTYDMPHETQVHIENTAAGAQIAARIDRRLKAVAQADSAAPSPKAQNAQTKTQVLRVDYESREEASIDQVARPRMR